MRMFFPWMFLFLGCLSPVSQNESVNTPMDSLLQMNQKGDFDQLDCLVMTEKDSMAIRQILDKYQNTAVASTGDLIIAIANEFTGSPYVAGTLETGERECLVMNVLEMDCTTFVEYVLAFTLTVRQKSTDVDSFAHNLQQIRYRHGKPEKYPSRLHYFSDWLYTHGQNGLISIVTDQIGTKQFDTKVNFMSENPGYYKQLSDAAFLQDIRKQEEQITKRKMKFLPKNRIDEFTHLIENGDIIAFTSTIAGLDVSHTAFALHIDNKLHFIHASLSSKQVEVSQVPLQQYLMYLSRVDGVLIGRLWE